MGWQLIWISTEFSSFHFIIINITIIVVAVVVFINNFSISVWFGLVEVALCQKIQNVQYYHSTPPSPLPPNSISNLNLRQNRKFAILKFVGTDIRSFELECFNGLNGVFRRKISRFFFSFLFQNKQKIFFFFNSLG